MRPRLPVCILSIGAALLLLLLLLLAAPSPAAADDALAAVVRNITRPDVAPPRGALDWDLRSHSFLLTPAQRARGLSHLGSNERLRLALHRAVTRE